MCVTGVDENEGGNSVVVRFSFHGGRLRNRFRNQEGIHVMCGSCSHQVPEYTVIAGATPLGVLLRLHLGTVRRFLFHGEGAQMQQDPMIRPYKLPVALLFLLISHGVCAQTWTMLAPPERPLSDLHSVWFLDRDTGWVCGARAGIGRLYRTTDGGMSWTRTQLPGSPEALHDVRFADRQTGVVVGDSEYVAITTDGGRTWIDRSSRLWHGNARYSALLAIDSTTVIAIGEAMIASGPRMARSTDGGRTWEAILLTGAANNLHDIEAYNPLRLFVVGTGMPPRRSISTNGGATWESNATMSLVPPPGGSSLSFYDLAIDAETGMSFVAGGKVFASPQYAELRISSDGGETWNATSMTGPLTPYRRPAGSAAPVGDLVIFVPTRGGAVWRSMNGGSSWLSEQLPTSVGTKDLRRSQVLQSNDLYIVGLGGVVLHRKLAPELRVNRDTVVIGDLGFESLDLANVGDGYLQIDSVILTTPSDARVQITMGSHPSRILPMHRERLWLRGTADSGTPPGLYRGHLAIHVRDSSVPGGVVHVPVLLAISVRALQVNNGPRDAGTIRVDPNISASLALTNLLENVGNETVSIIDIRLARGIDFELLSPIPPTTLVSGRSLSITVDFQPTTPCVHFDTVIIQHDASTPGSPIRIPIRGNGIEPSIQVSPRDTIDFGGVLVAAAATDTLRISNAEPGTCLDTTFVDTLFIIGPQRSEFAAGVIVRRGTRVAPMTALSVPITATPTAPGIRIAQAVIRHELSRGIPDTVVLIVNGLRPELTTSRNEIVFDLTDVGGVRDSTIVDFVQNLSNAGVVISSASIIGIDPADFSYRGPSTPFSLPNRPAPNHKQSIDVRFNPTARGVRQAVLRFFTSAGVKDVELRGMADSAQLDARISVVLFQPETQVGDCRDTTVQRIIFNRGSVPLRIHSVWVGADPTRPGTDDSLAFSIISPTVPPTITLAPGDSIEFSLRFCPFRSGVHQARLYLETNGTSGTVATTLIGVGRGGTVVTVDSIVFTPTRSLRGVDTTVQSAIVNRRATPLRVDSIVISGADPTSFAFLGPATPFTLDSAADTTLQIRFSPKRRDRHLATLTVFHSAGNESATLLGHSPYPLLDIRPSQQSTLRTRIGQTRRLQIVVRNVGDDTSHVESMSILGSTAYSNTSVIPLPRRLDNGDSITVSVDFSPLVLCSDPATIRLRAEGVSGVYGPSDTVVSFSGIGIAPLMSSRAPEINFGPRSVGSDVDSATSDFLGNVDFTGSATPCADSTTLDSVIIVGRDATSFSIVAPVDPTQPRPSPAGGYHDLTIRFSPRSSGLKQADLLVYFDGHVDSVRRVELIGSGSNLPIRYGPEPNMADIDFGNLRLGWERDSLLTVTNVSATPITIDQLDLTAPAEFTVLSPATPFVLIPGTPVTVRVRFSPVASFGLRRSWIRIRSGVDVDSSFYLSGFGVGTTFRVAPDTVDFGNRIPPGPFDSVSVALNLPNGAVPLAVLDSVVIDQGTIIFGSSEFSITSIPGTLKAGETAQIGLRFSPAGPVGRRSGVARIYFDRHTIDGVSIRDSLDVILFGTLERGSFNVFIDPGPDRSARPGDRIGIPLSMTGSSATAAIDSLDLRVRFRRSMVRPVSITPAPGHTATFMGIRRITDQDAVALFRVRGSGSTLSDGLLATVDFTVLLGDALESIIAVDSGGVPNRPEITFSGDSLRFSVDEFCDAPGRLITFGDPLDIQISPNPILRTARIEYAVPALEHVQLMISDMRGNKVAHLVDGERPPGRYIVQLDASQLPAGTYRCILVAGRFSRTLTINIVD